MKSRCRRGKRIVRISRETKGRGGTVKEGVIEVQGDHCDKVMALLKGQGHTVKRAGGPADGITCCVVVDAPVDGDRLGYSDLVVEQVGHVAVISVAFEGMRRVQDAGDQRTAGGASVCQLVCPVR